MIKLLLHVKNKYYGSLFSFLFFFNLIKKVFYRAINLFKNLILHILIFELLTFGIFTSIIIPGSEN